MLNHNIHSQPNSNPGILYTISSTISCVLVKDSLYEFRPPCFTSCSICRTSIGTTSCTTSCTKSYTKKTHLLCKESQPCHISRRRRLLNFVYCEHYLIQGRNKQLSLHTISDTFYPAWYHSMHQSRFPASSNKQFHRIYLKGSLFELPFNKRRSLSDVLA